MTGTTRSSPRFQRYSRVLSETFAAKRTTQAVPTIDANLHKGSARRQAVDLPAPTSEVAMGQHTHPQSPQPDSTLTAACNPSLPSICIDSSCNDRSERAVQQPPMRPLASGGCHTLSASVRAGQECLLSARDRSAARWSHASSVERYGSTSEPFQGTLRHKDQLQDGTLEQRH